MFYFHLARELGWKSVEDGLENISASELTEWKAYFSIYPFRDVREDMRMGVIASSIYNSHRNSDKQKILTPKDFMFDFLKSDNDIKPTSTIVNDDLQTKARLFRLMMS